MNQVFIPVPAGCNPAWMAVQDHIARSLRSAFVSVTPIGQAFVLGRVASVYCVLSDAPTRALKDAAVEAAYQAHGRGHERWSGLVGVTGEGLTFPMAQPEHAPAPAPAAHGIAAAAVQPGPVIATAYNNSRLPPLGWRVSCHGRLYNGTGVVQRVVARPHELGRGEGHIDRDDLPLVWVRADTVPAGARRGKLYRYDTDDLAAGKLRPL